MTTITLPPDIEKPLAEEARRQGTTTELLALAHLRERFCPVEPDEDAKMESREIDQEVAEQIIHNGGCVFDEKLTSVYRESYSSWASDWEVYRVGDGRVLAVERRGSHSYRPDGTMVLSPNPNQIDLAHLWNTLEEFRSDEKARREFREEWPKLEAAMAVREAENLRRLREAFSDGSGFINAAPRLAKELPERLGIDPSRLDGTPGSMKWVDEAVSSLGGKHCFEPDIFLPLMAYVGEVVCLATGGEWFLDRAMFYPVEQEVRMPCILSGRRVLGQRGCIHIVEDLMNDLVMHDQFEGDAGNDADFDSHIDIAHYVDEVTSPSRNIAIDW